MTTFLIALTDDNTLVSFDPKAPAQTNSVSVTGVEGVLLGVDTRPADGLIYGITTANKIYTIDPDTGAATFVNTLSQPFEGGTISGFDFNPVADRLRLVGDNDQNFRINVDTGEVIADGTLAFADEDTNSGVNPNITASAYTNSFAGTTATQLFNIDTLLNTLVLQNPPNDGTLVSVGELGMNFDTLGGFEIVSTMEGSNTAYAVSDSMLYQLDLETGMAMNLGMIGADAGMNLQGLTAVEKDMPAEPMVQAVALTDDNKLLSFDLKNPGSVMSIPVTGVDGVLLGVDVRPADGKLYGITTANKIYTIDPNSFDSGSFEGDFTLTDAEEAQLLNDAFYVNLHTNTFNGGELRGQVNVESEHDIVQSGILLEESQEVGADVPDGPAMGSFDLVYDDATNTLRLTGMFSDLTSSLMPVGNTDVEGNPQSSIHLHQGKSGENGPIIRNLTVSEGGFSGSFTLTDEEEALLLDNALYVNLHTDGFAGGELRGQVNVQLEDDVVVLGSPIEESQEVGEMAPPDGPAMGSFDTIYDNSSNSLSVSGMFQDLTSPLFPVGAGDVEGNPPSAIHIHNGVAGENGPIVRSLTAKDDVATLVSTLSQPFEGGTISGFDFNPVADRLRLVGDNDQNFRINVDTGEVIADGTLAFADEDENAGVNPNITASGYTNSVDGATATQLFNIDTLLNTLVLQNPPNDGTLVTVGELGVDFDTLGGFDIMSSTDGANTAYAVSDSVLYTINLETGAATELAMLDPEQASNLQGFAVLPMDDLVGDGSVGMEGSDMGSDQDAGDMPEPMEMPMLEYGMSHSHDMHAHDMTHMGALAMSSGLMGNSDLLHSHMAGAMV